MTRQVVKAAVAKSISTRRSVIKDGVVWDAYEHQRVLAMRDMGYAWAKIGKAYDLSDMRAIQVWRVAWAARNAMELQGYPWASGFDEGLMLPIWRCFAHQTKHDINKLTEARFRWTRPVLVMVPLHCPEHDRTVETMTAEGATSISCPLCKGKHDVVVQTEDAK